LLLLAGMKSYYQPGSRSSDQLKVSGVILDEDKQKGEGFILKNLLESTFFGTEIAVAGTPKMFTEAK
jgi:hypothetical protein